MKGFDPVRLDEVNRKLELGIDFDIDKYCDLRKFARPGEKNYYSIRDLLLGRGDVDRNAEFYGSLLDASRGPEGPNSRWTLKVLNEFERRLNSCDEQDFDRLYAAVNKYNEVFNQSRSNDNVEHRDIILDTYETEKEYFDDNSIMDFLTNQGDLEYNQVFYKILVETSGDLDNPNCNYAKNILKAKEGQDRLT